MAVGRLTALATTETPASSLSASVTIPADGSVQPGDLLLLAAVMPSGSRTFVVSGVDGITSLGTAPQPGHTSETWWRIAQPEDLGATITVTHTGGAGGIRQILMLGKITGADPVAPIAGSAGAATMIGSTTKTTPALTDVPAGCREISVVWDSRGASTPNTSTWTPPPGQTRQIEAYSTGTGTLCSGAAGDSDTEVSGAIGGRVWTADQPAIGSAWTIAISPAPSSGQTIALARIEPTALVPAPGLTPGPVHLSPARVEPTTAVLQPAVQPGTAPLTPARVEPTTAVRTPGLAPGPAQLRPGRIEPTTAVQAPALRPGPAGLRPHRVEPTTVLLTPGLVPGPATLAPARVEPTTAVPLPAVRSLTDLRPDPIAATTAVFRPVLVPGPTVLQPAPIAAQTVVRTPAILGGDQVDDDTTVTIGTPYSPWHIGAPRTTAYDAARPRGSGWEVDAPW